MLMKTKDVVQRRRDNLRTWIDDNFNGSQARFIDETGVNQGELSGLLRKKSFGERKARALELQAKMPPYWLDEEHEDSPIIADSNVIELDRQTGLVPKISWVRAGLFCDIDDPLEPGDAKEWLICPVKHGPKTYVLQVDGPSMDSGDGKGYADGEDIFVDPDVRPENGSDVIARTPNGKATFKRYQVHSEGNFLLALNPDWPERIIKVPEGTVICGVVIYSGRPRRR